MPPLGGMITKEAIMQLRYINKGTIFNIKVLGDPRFANTEFMGSFYELGRGVTFYLECEQLLELLKKSRQILSLEFKFHEGSSNFTFTGRVVDIAEKDFHDFVLVDATSLIDESSRRKFPRMEVSVYVKLFKYDENEPNKCGDLMLQDVTQDISVGGLCLYSDDPLEDEKMFVAEFSFNMIKMIYMPVLHIRSEYLGSQGYRNYAHAFLYSAAGDSEEIKQLTLAMFDYRVNRR